MLPKTSSCFETNGCSKGALGPPDIKEVKPRQEDPEGPVGQAGCRGATIAPERGGPEAACSYLLHTVWDLRGAGQRPYTLHGQHVLQQLLTACGQTDRQWGSEPPPGVAALLLMNRPWVGRAEGRQRACISRRSAAQSKAELGHPGCREDSPGLCGGSWDRSSPSRGAFPGTNTDREDAERRLPSAEGKLGATEIKEASLKEGV